MMAFFRQILRLLFILVNRVEVHGRTDVFDNPRTLIVANHESFIDGILIGVFLPVNPTFVVHSTIAARPLFRFILKVARAKYQTVDATNPMAMKGLVKLIESGETVVIFPEGRVTVTGSLMKVYDGASFIAARTGATVIPVRLAGAKETFFSRLSGVFPRHFFPKINIYVCEPTHIPLSKYPRARDRRADAGRKMRALLSRMLVETRPRSTLYGAYLHAMENFGRGAKIIEDANLVEQSYASMLKMSLAFTRLSGRMTKYGEIVGLLLPNVPATLATFFGLSIGGRVPAMLNYTAGVDGLRAAVTASQIRTVLTSRLFLEKGGFGNLPQVFAELNWVYLEDLKPTLGWWDKVWVALRLLFPGLAVDRRQNPDDAALVLFTSGSEGKPKGVVHSHDSLLSNTAQVRVLFDILPQDKFMMALPLFHSFGLTVGAILPLVSGCRTLFYPTPLHYRIIPELIYDRDCTVLLGTPTFLNNYARFAHQYDFGRLRYVITGAEKLDEKVRKIYTDRFGLRILEGYGVTECAPVISINVPMAAKVGSVGQIVPGMDGRLQPVEGVGPDEGILEVKGPNLMKGYLRADNPGVVESIDSESLGWFSTGDIVHIDEEGFVFIRGRFKRFAKIAGEMISLEVVEKLAHEVSPEQHHAVVTRADSGKGEALVLFTTDATLAREELLTASRSLGVPELAVPRDIRLIDVIPLLGSGKTDYVSLQQHVQGAA